MTQVTTPAAAAAKISPPPPSAPNAPIGEYRRVALDRLVEWERNPRRYFNAAKLQELAESIKSSEVVEPIVVRPYAPQMFEIVAGNRRFRASRLAGKADIPAIVRQLSDAQALKVALIENHQREDVLPLEEAEGFAQLMDKSVMGDDVMTAEEIADQIGVSRQFIYQRLSLRKLGEPVKNALRDEKISIEHAVLLGTLQPKDQERGLKECLDKYNPLTVRELRDWIAEDVHCRLDKAPFDTKDGTLVPACGACTDCPKRAKNNPQAFPGAKGDVCTDPSCYQQKRGATIARRVEELRAKGEKVVRISEDYGNVPKGVLDAHKYVPAGKQQCKSTVTGVFDDESRQGQVAKVCTDKKCKIHHPTPSYGASVRTVPRKKSKTELAAARRQRAQQIGLDRAYIALSTSVKKLEDVDYRIIAQAMIEEMWNDHRKEICQRHNWEPAKSSYSGKNYEKPIRDEIERLEGLALQAFMLEIALSGRYVQSYGNFQRSKFAEIAKRHGVSVEAHEKQALAELEAKAKETEKKKAEAEAKKEAAAKKKPKAQKVQTSGQKKAAKTKASKKAKPAKKAKGAK